MIEALVAINVLLQLADLWTTKRFMAAGVREGNPFIRKLMEKFGAKWVIVKLAIALTAIFAAAAHDMAWLLVAIAGAYVWVVWHNFKVVK